MKHEELTKEIIGAFYHVYSVLGHGFLEKVYENALVFEFGKRGLVFERQVPIRVCFEGNDVGDYIADFLVGGKIIVEIKAVRELSGFDEAQVINYLKGTGLSVGLLFNFGREPKVKRFVFD